MTSLRWPYLRTVCLTLALLAGLWPTAYLAPARAASTGQLQQQIGTGQGQISSLRGAVHAAAGHVAQINANIAHLQGQVNRIQANLDAKRAELLKLRTELTAAKIRLQHLEAFQARAETVLSSQLISDYESDRPDIVSVVLEARGFRDLLERIAFATRVRKQTVTVVDRVRAARRAVAAQATRLGALEARQETITHQVLAQRNALARDKVRLVQQQIAAAQRQQQGRTSWRGSAATSPTCSTSCRSYRPRRRRRRHAPQLERRQRFGRLQRLERLQRLRFELPAAWLRPGLKQGWVRVPAAKGLRLAAGHMVA